LGEPAAVVERGAARAGDEGAAVDEHENRTPSSIEARRVDVQIETVFAHRAFGSRTRNEGLSLHSSGAEGACRAQLRPWLGGSGRRKPALAERRRGERYAAKDDVVLANLSFESAG